MNSINVKFEITRRESFWKERQYETVVKEKNFEILREKVTFDLKNDFDFEKEIAKFRGGKSRCNMKARGRKK